MASSVLSRSRVEWARRSSLVTINQSPGDTRLQNRASNYALINSKKEISAATRERSFYFLSPPPRAPGRAAGPTGRRQARRVPTFSNDCVMQQNRLPPFTSGGTVNAECRMMKKPTAITYRVCIISTREKRQPDDANHPRLRKSVRRCGASIGVAPALF
jgi:hypothetical protein